MNLRGLNTLVEIAQVGSFAGVAERTGLTLSAISIQMKTLEAELQLSLFDRSHRPPTLTPTGRQVVAYARSILADAEKIRTISKQPHTLHGTYQIGFVPTASVRLMPQFLSNARVNYPNVTFQVESALTSELMRKLRSGLLDAAVLTETAEVEAEFIFKPLTTERFVLAKPYDSDADSLQDCMKTMPFIQFAPSIGIGAIAASHLRDKGIEIRQSHILDSIEAAMGCVNAGVGFAILPEPDARRYATRANIQVLGDEDFHRRIGLAVPISSAIAGKANDLAGLFSLDEI